MNNKQATRVWIVGQVIALVIGVVVYREFGIAVALPVAYTIAILVDIRSMLN